MTIQELLNSAVARLRAAQKPSAELDARLLLLAALNFSRHPEEQPKGCSEGSRLNSEISWTTEKLLAHPEAEAPADAAQVFETYIARRLQHEPVALILGYKEFYGRQFLLNADVLQPRPETEAIVEKALTEISSNPQKTWRVLDIGTGCGAIAITLAIELAARQIPYQIVATEVSPTALNIARQNAQALGATGIEWQERNLLTALKPQLFDIIVANLPYVPEPYNNALEPEVLIEPAIALFGGEDGLDLYRALSAQIAPFTTPDTLLIFECAQSQAEDLRAIFSPYRTHIVT